MLAAAILGANIVKLNTVFFFFSGVIVCHGASHAVAATNLHNHSPLSHMRLCHEQQHPQHLFVIRTLHEPTLLTWAMCKQMF